jgi:hypothetical protein
MIITRILGGLGNQMFQYACAKTISIANNVELKLDANFYKDQNLRKYELDFFEIKEEMADEEEVIALSGNANLWFKVRKKLGFRVKKPASYYVENQRALYDVNIIKPCKELYLDGYWQNSRYFDKNRRCILKSFSLKQNFRKNKVLTEYLGEISKVESVALHVRRGHHSLEKNQEHHVCNLDYYKKAIFYMQNMVKGDCVFFIFSDDISWCKDNFLFINKKVFVTNTGASVYDLELMKNCKHNIISNSTFSWWGAWLNDFEHKIVIAPKIWWSSDPNRTIALDSWVKI